MQKMISRQNFNIVKLRKLIIASLLVGFFAAFLAIALKRATEHYEDVLFAKAEGSNFLLIIFPLVGFTLIYFLRQYLFNKKENKGMREIFVCTQSRNKKLPMYKIPSHFVNGLLTVAFGGSTGIEVSTVVASATIGSVAQRKDNFLRRYKNELICAGVAAGITALFTSPVAGVLFTYEVIFKKINKAYLLTSVIAVCVASALLLVTDEPPLFAMHIAEWHYYAIPYFILLGLLAGLNSIYLTRCVMFFKARFATIETFYYRILIGALSLSALLIIFPQLYGDGYHALRGIIAGADTVSLTLTILLTFGGILILKPVATSITLASGGDGGVFAPGIFIGAFLGLLTALVLNTYFDAQVIPLNFLVVGMAAMLSASIHAPFTAIFLVCGLTGDYTLFVPLLVSSVVAKYSAKFIYPHTVYTMPVATT